MTTSPEVVAYADLQPDTRAHAPEVTGTGDEFRDRLRALCERARVAATVHARTTRKPTSWLELPCPSEDEAKGGTEASEP